MSARLDRNNYKAAIPQLDAMIDKTAKDVKANTKTIINLDKRCNIIEEAIEDIPEVEALSNQEIENLLT